MSYFSGCCIKYVKLVIMSTMMMSMMFFQLSMGFNQEDDNDINPLYQFSSREELVSLAGYGEDKISTVLITGSLLCEPPLAKIKFPISGAIVGINCGEWSQQASENASAITDEDGEFQIDLPSHMHAIPDLDKTCSIKVVGMPKSTACRPKSGSEKQWLTLLLARDGVRIYTAGEIKFSLLKESIM